MATTNFKGQPVKLIGEFIQVGKVAPDFELVKTDLSSFSLKDLNGKNVILNIFPSLDTSVCATSVRKFNKMAAGLKDTVVLAISKDLPLKFVVAIMHVYLKFTLYRKQLFPQICSRKTFSKFNLLFLNEITLVFNLKYKMYGNCIQ